MSNILWFLAGLFFIILSAYNNIKGDREWGYRYNVLALLNWIVYYLSVKGKA